MERTPHHARARDPRQHQEHRAGAGKRRFEQGRLEAEKKEQDVLQRLRAMPDGERKAEETKRMIDRVRTFIGTEYPKYAIVSRYFVYKQALLEEAERPCKRTRLLRRKTSLPHVRRAPRDRAYEPGG